MSSQTEANTSGATSAPTARITWLGTLLIVAVAVAAGFGAGYLAFAPDASTDITPEVDQVLADFWTAADAGDIDAVNQVLVEGWATFFDHDSANWPASVIRTKVEAWANVEGPSPVGEPWVIENPNGSWDVVQRGTIDGEERFYYFAIVDTDADGTTTDSDGLKILIVDDHPWVGLG